MKPSAKINSWKIILEYDGSRYSGWQEQRNARTISGELRIAAEDVFGGDVEVQGSGRTDAGVHALQQVALLKVTAPKRHHITGQALVEELNERLPADIAVLDVEPAPPRFHPRHDATARRYVYQISTRKSAFSKRHVWWIKEPLDTELMAQAVALLPGRHDFIAFRAKDPARPDESTIVVVHSASLEVEEPLIVFHIEASHYLWRMVRRIVGTLVKLGLHEITLADFEQLLNTKPEPRLDVAGWTAPSSGLFLESVSYE